MRPKGAARRATRAARRCADCTYFSQSSRVLRPGLGLAAGWRPGSARGRRRTADRGSMRSVNSAVARLLSSNLLSFAARGRSPARVAAEVSIAIVAHCGIIGTVPQGVPSELRIRERVPVGRSHGFAWARGSGRYQAFPETRIPQTATQSARASVPTHSLGTSRKGGSLPCPQIADISFLSRPKL